MKVALVDPSLFTIPYDCALVDALRRAGAEATLYGRRLRPHEEMRLGVAAEPHFYRLSEGRGGPLGKLLKGAEHALDMTRLLHRLGRDRPDAVHLQWSVLPLVDPWAIGRLRRLAPVVMTVHDTTPFNADPTSRLQRLGAGTVLAAPDRLIVHTEGAKAQLAARGIDPGRIAVIPHGLLPAAAGGAAAPADEAETVLLLFGKLKPYKGADVLIEAFARLPAALRARARIRIVGEPHMPVEPLQARARALGVADRIDWDLRYVAEGEIGGILAGAGVLVFPYREIDTSGVLMTALGCGKPVVASALGAFRSLIEDGVHGRLVPPDDPDALSRALGELIADPPRARAMGAALAGLAGAVPSWDDIARRTLALYAGLREARSEIRSEKFAPGDAFPHRRGG